MKTCPQCHKSWPDYFVMCDCGYEFRVREGILGDKLLGFPKDNVGCYVVFFSVVGLVPSSCCILSAILNTFAWESNSCSPIILDPLERLFSLAVGLLVGGAALYAIMTTRDYWSDLPEERKFLVTMTIVFDIVLSILVVCALMLSTVCTD
jgi:hypothetical protein